MTSVELVNFLSSDKLRLPGVLFQPAQPTKQIALWLHGMGDNGIFYNSTLINELGESLTSRNIAFFAFNNRGAHLSKSLRIVNEEETRNEQHYQAGTNYELMKDSVHDIDGATNYLRQRGFNELYLIGISTGANKICAYDDLSKRNPFSKYVLASPGDDTGLYYLELGDTRFWNAIKLAKKYVSEGKPLHLMPKKSGMYPFSAQSALDILDPDGEYNSFPYFEATQKRIGRKPLFKELSNFKKPTLAVLGENDEWLEYIGGSRVALSVLKQYSPQEIREKSDYIIIPNGDHSFHDKEHEFAELVASWLKK